MATVEKPMGPLPGRPGDWRKSPSFWGILSVSLLAIVVGAVVAIWAPQHGGVVASVGVAGIALAVAVAAMASLRSRRRDDEQLREAP